MKSQVKMEDKTTKVSCKAITLKRELVDLKRLDGIVLGAIPCGSDKAGCVALFYYNDDLNEVFFLGITNLTAFVYCYIMHKTTTLCSTLTTLWACSQTSSYMSSPTQCGTEPR